MIYIPTWLDFLLLITSFMIGYELYRKDTTAHRLVTKYFVLIVASMLTMILAILLNQVGSWWSVALFSAAVLCLLAAAYLYKTRPPKLPNEPLPD